MTNHSEIFSDVHKRKLWGSGESVSGPGSSLAATAQVRQILLNVINTYRIGGMLDAPCGDFHWMEEFFGREAYGLLQPKQNRDGFVYRGMDVVPEIITENQKMYDHIFFEGDITKSPFGGFDLIFCRDCLVHFSFHDINLALSNIIASGSRYLLTTSFLARNNIDISTGQWRPLNLVRYLNLMPIAIYPELCQEGFPDFIDKSLVLYKISDLVNVKFLQ